MKEQAKLWNEFRKWNKEKNELSVQAWEISVRNGIYYTYIPKYGNNIEAFYDWLVDIKYEFK